mgnify:CR=1 FL=1
MNIVILATRISGNDGVSLECGHWKEILKKMGHEVGLVAGKLDQTGFLAPELSFQSPNIMNLHDKVVYGKGSYRKIEEAIFREAGTIEGKLRSFFNNGRKHTDLLITSNTFSLPMHFPLAVALARVIEELKLPTIARHHDFWWERKRYLRSDLFHFLKRWFPPDISFIKHVVINSIAQRELKKRTGINAEVIWDSFDFENKNIKKVDSFSKHFKSDFGIKESDLVFLQATRIVPRKRLELSVEFMAKLKDKNSILVFAGHSGDEGKEYLKWIKRVCKKAKIRYKFVGNSINSKRRIINLYNGEVPRRKRIYTLWDCYNNCDFVLYPTEIEGFGNQFVEAIYFKKPIIMTPYPVFEKDIKPMGFEVIEISENFGVGVVNKVNRLVKDKKLYHRVVEKNFKIGKKYLSYTLVEKKLRKIFRKMKLV